MLMLFSEDFFNKLMASKRISSPLYFLMKPKNNTMGISVSMPIFFLASDLLIFSPKLS